MVGRAWIEKKQKGSSCNWRYKRHRLGHSPTIASCNFDVVVCGRDLDAIRSVQNTVPNCSAIQIDVTKSDQIGRLLEFIESKFRRLDF